MRFVGLARAPRNRPESRLRWPCELRRQPPWSAAACRRFRSGSRRSSERTGRIIRALGSGWADARRLPDPKRRQSRRTPKRASHAAHTRETSMRDAPSDLTVDPIRILVRVGGHAAAPARSSFRISRPSASPSRLSSSSIRGALTSATMIWPTSVFTSLKMPCACIRSA
jgi:hypothetical protein